MVKQTISAGLAQQVAALGLTTAAGSGFTPANPAATASTTLVMMGLGCLFTAAGGGLVLVSVTGVAATATAAVAATVGGRYGTGTAPVTAAAVTGTRFGAAADQVIGPAAAAAAGIGFALTALLQLIPGTAYWFDLALATATTGDHASMADVGLTIIELP